ncbi:hypothetical protein G5I_00676 [Acromyrmex echinatior]|uniref:Uncharacterized protein n=1 Tax=Acromyrmex echinatior TaxID=103372 RepID=F4W5H9_ACREC|nr:hypothetical protein G5I_00676 [Acromyrmex echinatior]
MASGKLGHSVYDLWFLAWDTLCRSGFASCEYRAIYRAIYRALVFSKRGLARAISIRHYAVRNACGQRSPINRRERVEGPFGVKFDASLSDGESRRTSAASVRLERTKRVVASKTSLECRPVTGHRERVVRINERKRRKERAVCESEQMWCRCVRECCVSRESASGFGHRGIAGASVHAVEMKTCHLWLEAVVVLLAIAVYLAVLVYVDSRTDKSVVCNAWGEHSLITAPTFTDASVH